MSKIVELLIINQQKMKFSVEPLEIGENDGENRCIEFAIILNLCFLKLRALPARFCHILAICFQTV